MDDYRNAYNAAGTLGTVTPGGSSGGVIETGGDHDVFAISLVMGTTYSFDMTPQAGGTLTDTYLTLQDANGSYITSNSGFSSAPAQFYYTAAATGTFYLSAGAAYSTSVGSYTLHASSGFVDDFRDVYNDTLEAAGSLTAGNSINGTLEIPGDKDVLGINLVAGRTYSFDLKGQAGGTLADAYLTLQDANGSYLTSNSGFSGNPAQFYYTATASGQYYLSAAGAYSTSVGTYTLHASAGFIDDYRDVYNSTIEALGSLTPGSASTGTLEIPGDHDIFAVSLVAGRTYTFEMKEQAGGTLSDAYLTLQDGSGSYLTGNSGFSGSSAKFDYTASTSGTYYLSAAGAYSTSTGAYTVSATSGLIDDYRDTYNDTTEALGAIAPGGTASGQLELAGDKDVFAVSLTAGRTYSFDLGPQAGSALPDTALTLLDANGSYLTGNSGAGSMPAHFLYTAGTTGTYYLSAAGASNASVGGYNLSVSSGFVDDYRDVYNDPVEALGAVSPGGSATGTLETGGDEDVFAVSLTAGQTYTFTLQPQNGSTLADPYLTLLDGNGSYLTGIAGSSGASATFQFTAVATGTHYLSAAANAADSVGTYQLLVSAGAVTDDYRNTVSDPALPLGNLLVNGSSPGTIETGGDHDVFAVSLTAGQSYTFDLTRDSSTGPALADPSLKLLDTNGALLRANNDFNSVNSRIVYTAATTGTYYLDAFGASASMTGHYTIGAQQGFDDFRDTITDSTAALGMLAANKAQYGAIETTQDHDVFRLSLTAGQSYSFDLLSTANGGTALPDPFLKLLNSAGTALFSNNDFNSANSRIVYTASTTGTYYLDASSRTAGGVGDYAIIERQNFDDFRDSVTDTTAALGALTAGKAQYGAIETAQDHDVFRLSLTAGQSYTFDLLSTANGGTALPDPFLKLLNSAGTTLFSDNDFNSVNSRIVYTASATGTYYLDARNATATGTGDYAVIERQNFDDFRDSITDTTAALGSLSAGMSLHGSIETAADQDVFAVTLTAGQSYTFDLLRNVIGGTAIANPLLQLMNSAGSVLITNDDFNSVNSRIVYTPTASGKYYLGVTSATSSGTGNYLLGEKLNFDDYRDSTTDPTAPFGAVAVGGHTMGAIETPGDSDLFRFSLVAGKTYAVDLHGDTTLGALHSGDMQLLNATGTMVAYAADDAGTADAHMQFTAPAAGTYYLNVHGIGMNTGVYDVHLSELYPG